MPALAKPPVTLPRFVPHSSTGAEAGAGSLSNPEDLAGLAHDARNVLSGLMLYGELLATPGVLNSPHQHYAEELQDIAASAARLIDRMTVAPAPKPSTRLLKFQEESALPTASRIPLAATSVADAAADLRRLQPLLASVAGPAVRLAVATMPCAGHTALAVEDFTRILVNLVRNAADAMPFGGHIGIAVQYRCASESAPSSFINTSPRGIVLTVSDDGPGIPDSIRHHIFDPGFTTHRGSADQSNRRRRGLGLSIVRNLLEAAGGTVQTTASHTGGARFEIVLPFDQAVPSGTHDHLSGSRSITSGTCLTPPNETNPADSGAKGCIKCQ